MQDVFYRFATINPAAKQKSYTKIPLVSLSRAYNNDHNIFRPFNILPNFHEVTWSVIISNKHGIYKLPHELLNDFKAHSPVWRQLLATESPLKMMKMLFISPLKLFLFSRYFSFCLDFLVTYKNGFLRKIRLIFKFMTSQLG